MMAAIAGRFRFHRWLMTPLHIEMKNMPALPLRRCRLHAYTPYAAITLIDAVTKAMPQRLRLREQRLSVSIMLRDTSCCVIRAADT